MRRLSLVVAALIVASGLARSAWAQTATGQITGTVTDSTGAVMSGVKVTVTNQDTGLTRETTTNESGTYTVPLLRVGVYLVTAEQAGFKVAVRSDIQLNVDQVQRIDLELSAGNISERVEVQANRASIDTETSTVGQVITEKQVTDLPLNGRNFLQLLFLGAGAVEADGEQGAMRQGVGNAISIMGARPTSNNYMLDGTANVDTSLGTVAAVLSIDAIQEFKEQTSSYSAEYGFSSNQINIVSKSGTNDFHGSGFYFMRNEKLDARNFFDPPDAEKPKLDQKQPGFVVGGPVFKNKTFFLVNYEGVRLDRGSSGFDRVPTPEQLAGHFDTTIIDPQTGQPFPNNTIPQSRFSRLANLAVAKFAVAPNIDAPQGNLQTIRTLPTDQDQYTIRVDHNLGTYGTVFGRFTKTTFTNISSGSINELGDVAFDQDSTNWQLTHTWVVRTNLVNNFRFGRVKATANQGAAIPADEADISALGLTGVFTNLSDPQRAYPRINMNTYSQLGGGTNVYTASYQPMWDVSNTTTWVKGDHTLNMGFNFRSWQLNRDLANEFLGAFAFSGDFTGDPVADMLLGYYSSVGVFQPAAFSLPDAAGNPREFNFRYFAPYVQDDWKVSPRLTVNLGLRWDYRTTPTETNDRMGWLDTTNPLGGMCIADQSLVDKGIVGDGSFYRYCGRNNPKDPSKTDFGPRLGFAYRPFDDNGRTVVRGGYGIFYDSAEGREIDGSADIYPYVSRGSYTQSIGQLTPLQTTDQLFPVFSNPGPVTPAANSFIAVIISENPKDPYVQQWSLGVQRELTSNTTLELNYIGSKGSNLLMRRNIAQALPYTPEHPSVQERKPFPQFGVYINSDWSGFSNYNAFNAKIEHRGRGSLATLAYTWAKSTDSKSAAAGIGASGFNGWQGFLNNHDPLRDHGLSDFDVDHRLVASFVYNLPFGRGEKYGSDASPAKNLLIGGWQVNGIYTWQHGFPLTVTAADEGGVLDTFGTNRANLVGDPNSGDRSINRWFNTAAFAQPALGEFGNSGRNILRGPGINNLDFALFKNFELPRNMRFQFRLESFNAFNHPQWNGVNTDVNSPQFGVITGARPGRINQLGFKFLF